MSRKPKSVEDLAFEHRARQFYIGCSKHALSLAPLPEFQDAVSWLELYDEDPSDENREDFKKFYRALINKRTRRDYGYTAVGEFYAGLVRILYAALFRPDSVASYSGQHFTEAYFCAGRALRCDTADDDVSSRAQNKEYERQASLYNGLFGDREKQTTPIEPAEKTVDAATEIQVIDAGTF